jgi:formate--tetrahydrofolate ligase
MAVLLKDALAPNLVQTLENNPASCTAGRSPTSRTAATRCSPPRPALKLADYVVTEAGFGADLGAEKFIDIKCRKSGLRPARRCWWPPCARSSSTAAWTWPSWAGRPGGAGKGPANLERHLQNVREHYGLPCVVSINHFTGDTEAEHALLRERIAAWAWPCVRARHWAEGGAGAADLAHEVVRCASSPAAMRFVYEDADPLWDKMRKRRHAIYGASRCMPPAVRADRALQADGYGHYPVCVAKTQYSFSTDPKLRGAPSGHVVDVREVRLAAGAEFVVMVCGDVMTMPGLPKVPRRRAQPAMAETGRNRAQVRHSAPEPDVAPRGAAAGAPGRPARDGAGHPRLRLVDPLADRICTVRSRRATACTGRARPASSWLAAAIWLGNRWLLFKQREHFDWFNTPGAS